MEGLKEMVSLYDDAVDHGIDLGMEKGRIEGMAEGMAKGRIEGMAEGRAEARAETTAMVASGIVSLIEKDGMTFEEAVSRFTIPEDRIPEIEAEVRKRLKTS